MRLLDRANRCAVSGPGATLSELERICQYDILDEVGDKVDDLVSIKRNR